MTPEALLAGTGVSMGDLARLCRIAYLDRVSDIAGACNALGWLLVRADLRGTGDGRDSIVVQRGETRVVAIAGTEPNEWGDVRRALRILEREKVAPGVWNIVGRVRRRHAPLVAEWSGPVVLTGHSLGGAAALVLSLIWAPAVAVAFGAPRAVRRSVLASSDTSRMLAVENRRDPVPKLPPWPFGYARWPRHLRLGARGLCSLAEHHIGRYVDLVDGAEGR